MEKLCPDVDGAGWHTDFGGWLAHILLMDILKQICYLYISMCFAPKNIVILFVIVLSTITAHNFAVGNFWKHFTLNKISWRLKCL